MNCLRLLVSIMVVILLSLHAKAGEAEDRIAEFLAHQSQVEACMSVLIWRTGISEWTDPNLNENLSLSDVLQRLIICKDTNEERLDAMRKFPRNHSIQEAQVIAGGECLHWTSSRLKQLIDRIEMKAGRPMQRTESMRVHPFTLPVTTTTIVLAEMPDENIFHHELQIIEEYAMKDGRYRAYFVGNGWGDKGACEVTFAKEPRWAVAEYKMYLRENAPKPTGKLTSQIIKNWTVIHTTITEWQPIDDEPGWLPSKVNMESDDQMINAYEFLLTDWKLGKDVDRSPLQKSQFTPQNIPRQIDFDKVAAAFDEMRAKQKK